MFINIYDPFANKTSVKSESKKNIYVLTEKFEMN
jgi:hypothetical protein